MFEDQLRRDLERLAQSDIGKTEPPGTALRAVRIRALRRVAGAAAGTLTVVALIVVALGRVGFSDPGRSPTNPANQPSQSHGLDSPIAFVSDRGEGPGQEVFISRGSGAITRVTNRPGYTSGLSWSPSHNTILMNRGLSEGRGSLVLVDVTTGVEEVLLTDEGSSQPLGPGAPAWSPDGTTIAFSSARGDIYLVDRDGGSLRLLVPSEKECGHIDPAWSPDGERLVFARDCDDGGLFVVSIDVGEPERLTADATDTQPIWSPVADIVAFSRGGEGGRDIFTVQLETGTTTRLTSAPASYSPAWSPDGTQLAFGSNRNGTQDIWVMNADGSDQRELTADEAVDLTPAW